MASNAARGYKVSPEFWDRAISAAAMLLLALVAVAIVRAMPQFPRAIPIVWFHLATVIVPLALTPVILLRPLRGDKAHRIAGYIWCTALIITALASFQIRQLNNGGFSYIHILSVATILQVGRIIYTARRHQMVTHRRGVRILAGIALLGAGYTTFPFGRMLGQWLFG